MRQKSRYGLFLVLGFIAVLGVWLFRDPLRNRIAQTATLANPTPPLELVEETIEASPNRPAAILAAWNTGKIVHRQAAVREISRSFPVGQSLPAELESIVLTGVLDVDMNVRETALGILRDRNHSALPSLAAAQLRDPDPQVRLLGLNHLKRVNANIGVPTTIPLLDQDDPLIVATGLKLLVVRRELRRQTALHGLVRESNNRIEGIPRRQSRDGEGRGSSRQGMVGDTSA